jgi:hypothetical protein
MTTFIHSLCSEFPDSDWALKYYETSDTITTLLSDFAEGKAVMVGDGSYDDVHNIGAGACMVASADGTEYIIVGGPTPGPLSQQNAYRSEIGTIVSIGIISHVLSSITASSPKVIVSCDNDNALERPFLTKKDISAKQKSADLISLAHDIWQASPATPIPTRVKGHADLIKDSLSLLEKLNCIVDHKAKEFLTNRPCTPMHRKSNTLYGLPHITFKGQDITGQVSTTLQSLQSLQRSKEAAIRTGRFSHQSWNKLDHVAIARSAAQSSTARTIFITKWASRQLPVGTIMTQ